MKRYGVQVSKDNCILWIRDKNTRGENKADRFRPRVAGGQKVREDKGDGTVVMVMTARKGDTV